MGGDGYGPLSTCPGFPSGARVWLRELGGEAQCSDEWRGQWDEGGATIARQGKCSPWGATLRCGERECHDGRSVSRRTNVSWRRELCVRCNSHCDRSTTPDESNLTGF